MASEKILDVEIYHDSCHIVAHLEGTADPMECKQEIMDLLDELEFLLKENGQFPSNQTQMTRMQNFATAINKVMFNAKKKLTEV